eukprot:TRINITY_DN14138_c0_g1_i2.p1 TRINITY_DN14138_c0_g1~~TRINITY_DN14138_c0_g1_i2.p1  ORF type:complete len:287 (-),score=75.46 TRINITY_DN14138_c0_g1_i2:80-829(-)
MKLNPASEEEVVKDRAKKRRTELLQTVAPLPMASGAPPSATPSRLLRLAFFLKPVAILPDPQQPHTVGSVRFEKTQLVGEAGRQEGQGTGHYVTLPASLVLRSIGYQSHPVEGVAFDGRRQVVPSRQGRVLKATPSHKDEAVEVDAGLYVSGWLKRGPSGIIGTNITDAQETVDAIAQDLQAGKLAVPYPTTEGNSDLAALLRARHVRFVDEAGWKRIDAHELQRGMELGKARCKVTSIPEMLNIAGIH